MRFNCLEALEPLRGDSLLFTSVSKISCYSFNRTREDERLSQPWSHPVVLNLGSIDWVSSALTTRSLNVLNIEKMNIFEH